MSISIKSITVSVAGASSNMFKIEIDGAKYRLDNFTLTQRLLSPNKLSFSMYKDPLEDISETQFTVCSTIIGKPVTLMLQTDPMEQEIPTFSDGGKMKEIEFKGVIISATGSRSETQYRVDVEACGWESLLNDNPCCKSYEEKKLQEIAEDVLDGCGDLEFEVNPRYTEIIPYTLQYNENHYQFLQRLACRYGEWLFSNGKKLFFGKMPEGDSVTLFYPSKDIPTYHIKMQMQHVPFKLISNSYQENDYKMKEGKDDMTKFYNDLNESVYKASEENYQKETFQNLHLGGYAEEDSRKKILDVVSKVQARGAKAGMLIYEGQTYCSKLNIGNKLIIQDNYISDEITNNKSDVSQDEIIIIGVTHSFSSDERYSNWFRGIPATCDYPPYLDREAYPRCPPCRAKVHDTEDPKKLGRIRVQFDWQLEQEWDMISPWLRIVQSYGGLDKGANIVPEVNEEVLIDFEGGNGERPYVSGTFFNGKDHPDKKWYPGENEVKAIRTKNGHTIEVHDKGKGGYIKIYDNKKNNYVITLSTDQKLIKLHSSGNIELDADNDIIMRAGHDMKIDVANRFEHTVGETLYTNSIEGGLVTTETQNVDITVKEHSKIYSQTKEEEAADEYYFSNRLGGFSMGQADNCFGIYASENLSIKVEDNFGVDAESYIMNASGNAFLTSDGNIEIAASEVHMN